MAETINNAIITGPIPSNTIWPTFGIPAFSLAEEIDVACDTTDKLAEAVLEEYGITPKDESGASTGGDLTNLDVKRMDAMTLINLSLIERAAKSGKEFIEVMVNSEGEVEFREIGHDGGNIDDIYYEINTGSYIESPKAVMVTGGRPLPDIKDLSWYPIWGENPTRIYTAQNMFGNCRKQDFIRNTSIVFNDPQLTTAYNDRIDNLYEITDENPWDRVVGYVKYINPGTQATKDTIINYTNSASVPIQIGEINRGANGPNMGTLVKKPPFDKDLFDPDCWTGGQDVSFTDGVLVEIPPELRYTTIREVVKDKFIKVSAVYLIGQRMQTLSFEPLTEADGADTPTTENARVRVTIEDTDTTTIKLEPGKHYAVAYEGEDGADKTPYIVFTKDVLVGDPFEYGKNQTFYINPTCSYAKAKGIGEEDKLIGTIFPHTKVKGILVNDIWVTVDLETPSITIYDPGTPATDALAGTGAKALEIAKGLEYYVAPIVIVEPPAPVAYAGPSTGGRADIVNQVPTTDNDPTSAEPFGESDMDTYIDEMQGGGMAITWSFLDEDSVEGMADMLYSHFQSDVIETIYTCGPKCNPLLGGHGEAGGVVNAIRYNYTDSGSYTVSVTEGPKLIGNLTQIDGGPTMKMSENFAGTGTVIDMVGDNIHFKVRIDGYGDRWGVNMAPTIVRKGDIVQCTVHNNPVEA